jgi:transposase
MKKKGTNKSRAGKAKPRTRPYPYEFRIKMVRLYLEEGYSTTVLQEQFGVSGHSVMRWVKAYREQGTEGLIGKPRTGAKPKLSGSVKHQIVGIKKKHPEYGPRRIADVLKRFFLIPANATSVHKTLSEEGLTKKAKAKSVKNPPKPRFFERSRPNQLWQSDIMTFRLAGRNAYWIKYYNYKRPHQGIGSLCPADRFFEIQHDLKHTLAKGVEENALELALRGRPVDPFYMVGRMGGQSVVIRAEKGKVKMLVDGKDQQPEKELVYDARKDIKDENTQTTSQNIRPSTENYGRAVSLDGTAHDSADLPADGHQPDAFGSVAEPGHRGDAQDPGSDEKRSSAAAQPPSYTADRKEAGWPQPEVGKAAQGGPGYEAGQRNIAQDGCDEKTPYTTSGGPTQGRGDHEGSLRSDERQPGSCSVGSLPKDLLQVGATRSQCVADRPGGSTPWAPLPAGEPPEAGVGKTAGAGPSGQRVAEAQNGTQGCADGLETGPRHGPGQKKISVSKRLWP